PVSADSSREHPVGRPVRGCRPGASSHGYRPPVHWSDSAGYGKERNWCGAMRDRPASSGPPAANGIPKDPPRRARTRLSLASELPPTMRAQKCCDGEGTAPIFAPRYNKVLVDLEKTLLRKVGQAIHRFQMIRDGDRVAVAVSGGKDSATLLEALILLQKRAPIRFSVCAFTVEQGKFLSPIQPIGEYIQGRGIPWTYFTDEP